VESHRDDSCTARSFASHGGVCVRTTVLGDAKDGSGPGPGNGDRDAVGKMATRADQRRGRNNTPETECTGGACTRPRDGAGEGPAQGGQRGGASWPTHSS